VTAVAYASLTHVQVVADCTVPTTLQRSTKLKISHDILISVFTPASFIFCQKYL